MVGDGDCGFEVGNVRKDQHGSMVIIMENVFWFGKDTLTMLEAMSKCGLVLLLAHQFSYGFQRSGCPFALPGVINDCLASKVI